MSGKRSEGETRGTGEPGEATVTGARQGAVPINHRPSSFGASS